MINGNRNVLVEKCSRHCGRYFLSNFLFLYIKLKILTFNQSIPINFPTVHLLRVTKLIIRFVLDKCTFILLKTYEPNTHVALIIFFYLRFTEQIIICLLCELSDWTKLNYLIVETFYQTKLNTNETGDSAKTKFFFVPSKSFSEESVEKRQLVLWLSLIIIFRCFFFLVISVDSRPLKFCRSRLIVNKSKMLLVIVSFCFN